MVLDRYLQWIAEAPAQARANATRALVDACGNPSTDRARIGHIELMLSALLDDNSLVVRRALAEAAAQSRSVPAHIVAGLAQDDSFVAAPVLRYSTLLTEAALVDAVAVGDAVAQAAVASRLFITAAVAAALAEVGHRDALQVLCGNPGADLSTASARRIVERFGEDGKLREAILARPDLDPALRHDLVVATAQALTAFAMSCEWMSAERADCVKRESREKAAVTIAFRSARSIGLRGPLQLVAHLRSIGHLTPALLLRSLLSGNVSLFQAALAELSGTAPARIGGHLAAPAGLGFASLYAKAAMPPALLPVFRAALQAIAALRCGEPDGPGTLLRPIIGRVLTLCASSDNADLARVAALLRRFEAEAVRDEIRAAAVPTSADDDDSIPQVQPWMLGHAMQRLELRSAA